MREKNIEIMGEKLSDKSSILLLVIFNIYP